MDTASKQIGVGLPDGFPYTRIVLVEWIDVQNVAGGWHDKEELKKFAKDQAYRVNSIGFVAHEDKDCIVLCSRHSPETDDYEPHYGMLERIPKKIIDKLTEVTDLVATGSDTNSSSSNPQRSKNAKK